MTGTRISNLLRRAGLLLVLANPLAADDLTLAGGTARLTGTVRSINAAGVVELASPLSPAPLLLKGGAVEKVEFSNGGESPEPPSVLIGLANGDRLPAELEALDERKLTVVSPDAGRLEIPRDCLAWMQLGVHRKKVVYSGPRSLDEWNTSGADMKNWSFERDSLIANGQAMASKTVALPQQFTLRFTLKWQNRQLPNFQVSFADPLKDKGEASDRYYLQFGSAGLELKREASKGKRYNTLLQLNRSPNQYSGDELRVEIRVDRKSARFQLFLNGEPEGVFADPIPSVPEGSGIAIVCNTPNGVPQEVRDIEILEYDDSSARHHAEDRGDSKTDSLISRQDDRWSGRLLAIRKAGTDSVFRFKSDFQKDPLEIPGADVSTVFFAAKDGAETQGTSPPFVLRLPGDGSLRVSSCGFTADGVSAVHPLLGALNFRRQGIKAMEWAASKSKPVPEP